MLPSNRNQTYWQIHDLVLERIFDLIDNGYEIRTHDIIIEVSEAFKSVEKHMTLSILYALKRSKHANKITEG